MTRLSNNETYQLSRRHFFDFTIGGLSAAAISQLIQADEVLPNESDHHQVAVPTHRPRASRAIHISLVGGYSQVDSFDYKPSLSSLHGKPIPFEERPETFFGSEGLLRQSDWSFEQRGECGIWISDLFPHLAGVADHLTIINSMVSDTANHTPATFQQLTGFQSNGFPTLGSWLSYGLGNLSEELPSYVVLPDARSIPSGGAANWSHGFLPSKHQGTVFRNGDEPIRNLFAKSEISPQEESDALMLLKQLNQIHLDERPSLDILRARMRSYELAARMQTSIPETMRFEDEPAYVQSLYGLDRDECRDAARRCLLARRLVERGVRYVQLYSGGCFGGSPRHGWDSHEDCQTDHAREAQRIDQPIAALITDLHQRGMLDDTLVLFTTEFGRTPFAQAAAGQLGAGRDHNPEGFTCWMAGGGLKSGMVYGKTDDIGWKAVEDVVTWPDFHATVLHLLGIDHERLTYYHNGIERRLTNVHGHVLRDLVA